MNENRSGLTEMPDVTIIRSQFCQNKVEDGKSSILSVQQIATNKT